MGSIGAGNDDDGSGLRLFRQEMPQRMKLAPTFTALAAPAGRNVTALRSFLEKIFTRITLSGREGVALGRRAERDLNPRRSGRWTECSTSLSYQRRIEGTSENADRVRNDSSLSGV